MYNYIYLIIILDVKKNEEEGVSFILEYPLLKLSLPFTVASL